MKNLPIIRNEKAQLIRWEPALYNQGFIADIPDQGGRYKVERLYKGSRKWILKLNGIPQPGLFSSSIEAMKSIEPGENQMLVLKGNVIVKQQENKFILLDEDNVEILSTKYPAIAFILEEIINNRESEIDLEKGFI